MFSKMTTFGLATVAATDPLTTFTPNQKSCMGAMTAWYNSDVNTYLANVNMGVTTALGFIT